MHQGSIYCPFKISFLEKDNLDLRNQLINKHLTVQKLQTCKDSTNLKFTESSPTLTTSTINNDAEKNSVQLTPDRDLPLSNQLPECERKNL